MALADLAAGRLDPAVTDLHAAAAVSFHLMAGGSYSQEAQEAVLQALGAIDGLRQGDTTHTDAAAACGPVVEVFVALVRSTPLVRFQKAQVRAAKHG